MVSFYAFSNWCVGNFMDFCSYMVLGSYYFHKFEINSIIMEETSLQPDLDCWCCVYKIVNIMELFLGTTLHIFFLLGQLNKKIILLPKVEMFDSKHPNVLFFHLWNQCTYSSFRNYDWFTSEMWNLQCRCVLRDSHCCILSHASKIFRTFSFGLFMLGVSVFQYFISN